MVWVEQSSPSVLTSIERNGFGPIVLDGVDHCVPGATWLPKPLVARTFDSRASFRVK